MRKEIKSRDRPAKENFKQLMRHEAPGSPEPEEKPVCQLYPECDGCPYPGHGFICWPGRCMRKEMERIQKGDNK